MGGPADDLWKKYLEAGGALGGKQPSKTPDNKSLFYGLISPPPGYGSSPPPVLVPPPPTAASETKPSSGSPGAGLLMCGMIVNSILSRKVDVIPGRVLPSIDDLALMEGRHIRAAFVYSDLHGFTQLVATQPTSKSFKLLHAFVEIANRTTKYYGGQVMDCAGDRVLSVFHRPLGNVSNEPVEDAVTFAIWLQTVFKKKIAPAFAREGVSGLSLGIGVDYGEAVAGCIGMKGNKRIVFFGHPANHAAKLQEEAGQGEIVASAEVDLRAPAYLANGSWNLSRQELKGEIVLRINHWVDGDFPPKAR